MIKLKEFSKPQNKKSKRQNRQQNGKRNLENIDQQSFKSPISITFPKSVVGFPDRIRTILKYVQNVTQTGTPTSTPQRYAINSGFAPDQTGSTHQPSYWDVYTQMYARYVVLAAKVEIEAINTLTVPTYLVTLYSDADVSGTAVQSLMESKYCKYRIFGSSAGGHDVQNIKLPWMTMHKLMGSPIEPDDNMYATTSATPSDIGWNIIKATAVDNTTAISLAMKVTIYFDIAFKDLTPYLAS